MTNLVFLLTAIAPFLTLFLNEHQMGIGLFLTNTCALLLLLALTLKYIRTQRTEKNDIPEAKNTIWLFLIFTFMVIADSIYFYRGIFHITSYAHFQGVLKSISAIAYVLAELFLFIYTLSKFFRLIKRDQTSFLLFITYSSLGFYLSFKYTDSLVVQFLSARTWCELIIIFAYHSYTVFSTLGTALLLTFSFRARNIKDFAFIAAFVLQYCFDFAVRYHMALTRTGSISPYRSGLTSVLIILAWSLFNRQDQKWLDDFINEKRTIRVWLTLAFSAAVCIGAVVIGMVSTWDTSSTVKVTLVVFVSIVFWCFANVFGIDASEAILADRMHVRNAIASKTANVKTHLDKIRFYEFRLFAQDLREIVQKSAREQCLIEMAKETELLYHNNQSDLEILASLLDRLGTSHNFYNDENYKSFKRVLNRMQDRQSALASKVYSDDKDVSAAIQVVDMLESLVGEMRHSTRAHFGIEIEFITELQTTVFISGTGKIRDAIQNFLRNSIDARDSSLQIQVTVSPIEDNSVLITIRDNGKGISKENLSKLGQYGYTVGKPNGQGVGLHSAFNTIRSMGGKYSIESKLGEGTTISVTLPLCAPPLWHTSKILLTEKCTLVVLDDDPSVHELFFASLRKHRLDQRGIQILSFSSKESIFQFLTSQQEKGFDSFYFFFDHQLKGRETSFDLISSFPIAHKTIFVTSYADNRRLQSKCNEYGAKLVSKRDFFSLPMDIVNVRPDMIILDDDPLFIIDWKLTCRERGKSGIFLSHFLDLMRIAPSLDRQTPILLDQELEGIKGTEVANSLHQLGFKRIFMASAYSFGRNDMFSNFNFLTVIDKVPNPENLSVIFEERA